VARRRPALADGYHFAFLMRDDVTFTIAFVAARISGSGTGAVELVDFTTPLNEPRFYNGVNDDPQGPQKIYDRVRALPGVASVGEPELNDKGTVGIVSRPRFRSPGRHPTSWSAGRS
jgi:hypothetical protein